DDLTRNETLKPVIAQMVAALLAEKDSAVRRETATSLGRFGDLSKSAVLALTGALKDDQPATRAAAANALGRIGAEARPSAEELLPLLKDADKDVQRAAIFALGRISPEDIEGVGTALTQRLKDEKDVEMRKELVVALGLLGDYSDPTATALAAVLNDADPELR